MDILKTSPRRSQFKLPASARRTGVETKVPSPMAHPSLYSSRDIFNTFLPSGEENLEGPLACLFCALLFYGL